MNRRPVKFFLGSCVAAAAALALIGAVAVAWPPEESANPISLENLRWLTGAWRCDAAGEPLEEHWTESREGVMVGMARIGDDPDRAIYEIILIEESDPAPVMSIRHFGKGLAVRDRKVASFKLTKLDDKEAVFDDPQNDFPSKIIYRVAGKDKLLVRLENKDNTRSKDFPMTRVKQ